jgi:hypothetical protein
MGSHCVHGAVDGLRTTNAAERESDGVMKRGDQLIKLLWSRSGRHSRPSWT